MSERYRVVATADIRVRQYFETLAGMLKRIGIGIDESREITTALVECSDADACRRLKQAAEDGNVAFIQHMLMGAQMALEMAFIRTDCASGTPEDDSASRN